MSGIKNSSKNRYKLAVQKPDIRLIILFHYKLVNFGYILEVYKEM